MESSPSQRQSSKINYSFILKCMAGIAAAGVLACVAAQAIAASSAGAGLGAGAAASSALFLIPALMVVGVCSLFLLPFLCCRGTSNYSYQRGGYGAPFFGFGPRYPGSVHTHHGHGHTSGPFGNSSNHHGHGHSEEIFSNPSQQHGHGHPGGIFGNSSHQHGHGHSSGVFGHSSHQHGHAPNRHGHR